VPASVGVAGIALLAALAPTLVWLYGQFTESVWRNQHGLFVPFFMVLAGLSVLRRDPHPEREESSAWGFAFLVPAALLLVADAGMGSRFLSAAGLALLPPGLALLLLGARRARALAVPLALGVFLIPTPEHLGDPLGVTWMSAVGSEWLTRALGIPVERLGTMLTVNGHPFEVSQNCGGLATLHAATAFAVMLAALGARRRIAPLLLAVYPLTVAANAVRCCGLMVATSYSPRLLDTPLHGLSGLAVFWSVVGALWCLADRRAVRENLS
jgi:exosortase